MGLRPLVLMAGLACGLVSWSIAGQEPTLPAPAESPLLGIELTVGDPLPRQIKGIRDADPGDRKIDAALDRIVTLRCRDVRLADLVRELERAAAIPIRLTRGDIVNEPVDPETRISIEVFDVPLETALDELRWQDIDCRVQNGKLILFVNTQGCDRIEETRLYSIALLKSVRADEVMDALKSQTSGPWNEDQPGTGTIRLLGDALVIRQNRKNHREAEGVLNLLLEAEINPLPPERQAPPKPPEPPKPVQTGGGGGFF